VRHAGRHLSEAAEDARLVDERVELPQRRRLLQLDQDAPRTVLPRDPVPDGHARRRRTRGRKRDREGLSAVCVEGLREFAHRMGVGKDGADRAADRLRAEPENPGGGAVEQHHFEVRAEGQQAVSEQLDGAPEAGVAPVASLPHAAELLAQQVEVPGEAAELVDPFFRNAGVEAAFAHGGDPGLELAQAAAQHPGEDRADAERQAELDPRDAEPPAEDLVHAFAQQPAGEADADGGERDVAEEERGALFVDRRRPAEVAQEPDPAEEGAAVGQGFGVAQRASDEFGGGMDDRGAAWIADRHVDDGGGLRRRGLQHVHDSRIGPDRLQRLRRARAGDVDDVLEEDLRDQPALHGRPLRRDPGRGGQLDESGGEDEDDGEQSEGEDLTRAPAEAAPAGAGLPADSHGPLRRLEASGCPASSSAPPGSFRRARPSSRTP